MGARLLNLYDGLPLEKDHAIKLVESMLAKAKSKDLKLYYPQFALDEDEVRELLVMRMSWPGFGGLHNINNQFQMETLVVDVDGIFTGDEGQEEAKAKRNMLMKRMSIDVTDAEDPKSKRRGSLKKGLSKDKDGKASRKVSIMEPPKESTEPKSEKKEEESPKKVETKDKQAKEKAIEDEAKEKAAKKQEEEVRKAEKQAEKAKIEENESAKKKAEKKEVPKAKNQKPIEKDDKKAKEKEKVEQIEKVETKTDKKETSPVNEGKVAKKTANTTELELAADAKDAEVKEAEVNEEKAVEEESAKEEVKDVSADNEKTTASVEAANSETVAVEEIESKESASEGIEGVTPRASSSEVIEDVTPAEQPVRRKSVSFDLPDEDDTQSAVDKNNNEVTDEMLEEIAEEDVTVQESYSRNEKKYKEEEKEYVYEPIIAHVFEKGEVSSGSDDVAERRIGNRYTRDLRRKLRRREKGEISPRDEMLNRRRVYRKQTHHDIVVESDTDIFAILKSIKQKTTRLLEKQNRIETISSL